MNLSFVPYTRLMDEQVSAGYDRVMTQANSTGSPETMSVYSGEIYQSWWQGAAVGAGVVGLLGAGWWWWRRRRRQPLTASASELRAVFGGGGTKRLRRIQTPSGPRCHDGKRFVPNARCRL